MRLLRFVWRTFFNYWRWAWRAHQGLLPPRVGPANRVFTVHVRGQNGEGGITLEGQCTAIEAHRLVGFRGIYEVPQWGIIIDEGITARFEPDQPPPTFTGPQGDVLLVQSPNAWERILRENT